MDQKKFDKRIASAKKDPELLEDYLPGILRADPSVAQIVTLVTAFPDASDRVFGHVRGMNLSEADLTALLAAFPGYAKYFKRGLYWKKQDRLEEIAEAVGTQQRTVEELEETYARTSADALRHNENAREVLRRAQDAINTSRQKKERVDTVGQELEQATQVLEDQAHQLDELQREVVELDKELSAEEGPLMNMLSDLPATALIAASNVDELPEDLEDDDAPLDMPEDLAAPQDMPEDEEAPEQHVAAHDDNFLVKLIKGTGRRIDRIWNAE